MTDTFVIEPLAAPHDRSAFSCGVDALDRYLRQQAGRTFAIAFQIAPVATPQHSQTVVAGYYTLAAASIPLTDLPGDLANRLPRYPVLPAALIGRLAVDRQYLGRSLGAALLFDAIERSLKADPAIFALIVDAKNDVAADFYRHFGFASFAGRPARLFLVLSTAARLSNC